MCQSQLESTVPESDKREEMRRRRMPHFESFMKQLDGRGWPTTYVKNKLAE